MAPYEYRVKCTPVETEQQAWVVEIWVKHTGHPDERELWRCCQRSYVEGRDWPHRPAAMWNLLLRALKV